MLSNLNNPVGSSHTTSARTEINHLELHKSACSPLINSPDDFLKHISSPCHPSSVADIHHCSSQRTEVTLVTKCPLSNFACCFTMEYVGHSWIACSEAHNTWVPSGVKGWSGVGYTMLIYCWCEQDEHGCLHSTNWDTVLFFSPLFLFRKSKTVLCQRDVKDSHLWLLNVEPLRLLTSDLHSPASFSHLRGKTIDIDPLPQSFCSQEPCCWVAGSSGDWNLDPLKLPLLPWLQNPDWLAAAVKVMLGGENRNCKPLTAFFSGHHPVA